MARKPTTRTAADRLHSVALHLMRAMRNPDESSGLSRARLSALSVVVFSPGITPAELAESEGVTRPTITSLIQGLENDGLVTRKGFSETGDRRFVRLFATAAGERALYAAREARLAVIERALADLTKEERSALARALDILEPRVAALFK